MIWRDVVGYEGLYQVSDTGQVRSLDRLKTDGRKIKQKILKQCQNNSGHLHVGLTKNGRSLTKKVHKLVAEAFLGPYPNGHEVCHGPNGKTDNSIKNLSYGTRRRNGCIDLNRDNLFSSKYPGVHWHKRDQVWESQIWWDNKSHYLGRFTSELEAAKAYTDFLDKHSIPC